MIGGDAMTRMRGCMIAGLAAVAAMMVTDAAAQDCPEWFKWLCPSYASSTATGTGDGGREERQPSRTSPGSGSTGRSKRTVATAAMTKPKSPQKQTLHQARSDTAVSPSPIRDPGDGQLARHEGGRESTLTAQEKEKLFREFLEWQSARNATNR